MNGEKLRRNSRNRSRTGCLTCKRRRVKCDEGQPSCARCSTARVHCEGYINSAPKSTTRATQAVLLPKPKATLDLTRLTITQPSTKIVGETEIENRYLRYFQEETTSGFESTWDWTLWNRIALQGSHHEEFIRYAVVAIGALHKSLRSTSPTGKALTGKTIDPMARLHREFAYIAYGKALGKMQRAIDGSSSLRVALLACLFIVCFESHTDNKFKALLHAQYGLEMMSQWTERPAGIEQDIIDAFENLDIQITTVTDNRTPEVHKKLLGEDLFSVESMPGNFKSLDEAKQYWNIVFRRSCHFIACTWGRTDPLSFTRQFRTKVPGSVSVSMGDNIHTTSFKVDKTLENDQKQFYAEIDHWLDAFDSVFNKHRQANNIKAREYVIATILRIQALVAKIILAGVVFTQQILYDQFDSEFTEIILMAHEVVSIRQSHPRADFWAGSFLLDLGLCVPLFDLVLRCRNPVLRREALDILNSWHVECWWDPLQVASIARFLMDVEEKGMVDGFIPESSRAILTAKSHVLDERRALIQVVQRTEDGLKWTEGWVKW